MSIIMSSDNSRDLVNFTRTLSQFTKHTMQHMLHSWGKTCTTEMVATTSLMFVHVHKNEGAVIAKPELKMSPKCAKRQQLLNGCLIGDWRTELRTVIEKKQRVFRAHFAAKLKNPTNP